jgi:hypothetical protein
MARTAAANCNMICRTLRTSAMVFAHPLTCLGIGKFIEFEQFTTLDIMVSKKVTVPMASTSAPGKDSLSWLVHSVPTRFLCYLCQKIPTIQSQNPLLSRQRWTEHQHQLNLQESSQHNGILYRSYNPSYLRWYMLL